MRKLTKNIKTKNTPQKKSVAHLTKHLPAKPQKNTPQYYLCMSECCLTGQKITKTAQDCKQKAPALVALKTEQKKQEAKKIESSLKQIVLSVRKLLVEKK